MKFDTPAGKNPIDQLKVVGKPTDRIDGPLKVTGTAPYAYERHDVVPNQAYGYVIGSGVAKGKISAINTRAASAAPGVLGVVTAQNAGPLGLSFFNTAKLLAGPDIQHYHQAVAIVIAETFEQARAAASLVQVKYVRAKGAYNLEAVRDQGVPGTGRHTGTKFGDFDNGFAAADLKLDQTYHVPDHAHAMMEPFASIAAWEGDKLTVWTSNQMIAWAQQSIAQTLNIPAENVRVESPYIGGGFGGKLFIRADAVLAALGAKAVGRPVKVALTRPMMFNNSTHRPATTQRIRVGAAKDGRIGAIAHEGWSGNLPKGDPEGCVSQTELLYAGADRFTQNYVSVLDLPEGNAMRAPGEAPGLMALEVAIDEMAEAAGLDPVEFRIRNDTQTVPGKDKPFSQRQFVECLRLGAERFGWDKRGAKPASRREGAWLVGLGVAGAIRGAPLMKSGARVRLNSAGVVTVETDMTDIGTGSYTIIAQTAAEMMGVGLDKVVVRLGDSTFPVSAGSGGQWGANCSTAGVYAACVKLREAAAQALGFNANDAEFVGGEVRVGRRKKKLADAAKQSELVAEDSIEFSGLQDKYEMQTFGSHFVEAHVHAYTGEIRVKRMLAVCAAGRILNPKSARSQVIGGMTMGLGAALMEELVVDERYGFFVNHDLAGYEVPVHADIPHTDVIFLDEVDPTASPMKAKGVGELGICGIGAAVANAVYNATGVRVRQYPITLEKHLAGLPELA